jgi:hypothetical protein
MIINEKEEISIQGVGVLFQQLVGSFLELK